MTQLEDEQHQRQQERETLRADLGRERIISKEEFFNRLDLVSYEGRARANSLLKTLDISVRIQRGMGRGEKAIVNYTIYQDTRILFSYHDHPHFGLRFHALDAESLDIAEAQGEPIDVAEQRKWIEQFEERMAWRESERKRLGELTKSYSYGSAWREICSLRIIFSVKGSTFSVTSVELMPSRNFGIDVRSER
ncbi:hypothetical protein D3C84_853660 [compost metagenome]